MRPLLNFLRNINGNFALIAAMVAPCLIGGIGVAADYTSLYNYRASLQSAVDTAALAAAKEMALTSATEKTLTSVAQNYVGTNASDGASKIKVDIKVDPEREWLKVTASKYWRPIFVQYLDKTALPIVVSAKAELRGSSKICMVGLNNSLKKTLKLDKRAKLVGSGCGVFSNSTSKRSIDVGKNSRIEASFICSAGGISGTKKAELYPTPVVDCPPIGDPLANRVPPKYTGCNQKSFAVKGGKRTIYPGVYCGGLKISKGATVTMKPGIYIIKDGKFEVKDKSSLIGEGVGIFMDGGKALLDFKKKSSIDLTAMESGEMAGILLWGISTKITDDDDDDDDEDEELHHKISSNDARNLLGTIYFPHRKLKIDSDNKVADESAYTAIIANQIELKEGPTLVLNSNYEDTNVPVPDSLRGTDPYLAN